MCYYIYIQYLNNHIMNSKNLTLNASEYALLGFLAAGPSHGYELHRKLTDPEGAGMIWGIKISNMYAQLEKLERRGLISGRLLENEQRPARTEYSLTATGRNLFHHWLHQPVQHPRDFRHEFFLQLYFVSQYEPDALDSLMDNQLELCRVWQQNLSVKKEVATSTINFTTLTNSFRSSQIQSMIDWLLWIKNEKIKIKPKRGEQ